MVGPGTWLSFPELSIFLLHYSQGCQRAPGQHTAAPTSTDALKGRKWTLLQQSKAFIENDGSAMMASQMHSTVFRALKRFERFFFHFGDFSSIFSYFHWLALQVFSTWSQRKACWAVQKHNWANADKIAIMCGDVMDAHCLKLMWSNVSKLLHNICLSGCFKLCI